MVVVMKIMATSFKRTCACTVVFSSPTLQQATVDPCLCQRILDTFGEVWVSLLWGHCFFLLGPCLHKVLSVPSKSLFPQSCVSSSSSMGGVNGDLLQEGLCDTQVCCTQSPCPCGRSLLTCTSTGDTQTQYWLSLCGGLWILGHKSLV